MSKIEIIGAVIQKNLAENPNLRKKLLQQEIFNRWSEILPAFSNKIFPVKIQGDTLIVDSNDSAAKDTLKFGAPNLVKLINAKVSPGLPIISEIKFGRLFENSPPVQKNLPVENVEEIELTQEEIAECEKKVAAIVDENQRQFLLETFLSYAKSQKRKLQRGWHKCKFCNVLCPPKEIFCNVCKVKERGRMYKEIRKIFCATPETSFQEIQQKIIQEFPHLKAECTLEAIESARMDLISQQAKKISYGDTNSDAVKFLVRLIRQLPLEKLTPQIINRTLEEFRFNLADLPPFEKLHFTKFKNRSIKKISK